MFSPGTIISEFTSKKGKKIVFRLAQIDDLEQMLEYVNALSKEDTFVSFSGEQISREDEEKYLNNHLNNLQKGDGFFVVVTCQDKIIGSADITRMVRRNKHVGFFNISLAPDYREEGIGSELMASTLELGKRIGLQMVELFVYEPNKVARHVYQKKGFLEVGRVPKKALVHGELVDEIIMVKFL